MSTNVWETFFDHHAPRYDEEPFTTGTEQEIAFLVDDIGLRPASGSTAPTPAQIRVLDLGCGTGRHAVALAARGFQVTGVDISTGMLDQARERARRAGVEVELVHADATAFDGAERFDAAICLCEGSLGLMGTDERPHEHDAAVLRTIFRALKREGMAVINALNGWKMLREHTQEDVDAGRFDPVEICETYAMEYATEAGTASVPVKEKGYLPGEFADLVRSVGFTVEYLWGGTAGNWGRRALQLDEFEMMVVARR